MPELPEVETIRRQLAPEVMGRRIVAVEVLDPRWCEPRDPASLARECAGAEVRAVERRGKYLLLRLDGERTLVMHLRMTGNLLLRPPRATGEHEAVDLMDAMKVGAPRRYDEHPDARYLRAVIRLDDGSELWFADARRFGTGALLSAVELEDYLDARVGIEPLSRELTAERLCELAAGRRIPLKAFLLTQSGVAGIGNIYADEALFRAGLHPLSPAGSMRPEHCETLRRGIVEALETGLAMGGASMDDYRDSRGERGSMQEEFLVHTREGEPCRRCGTEIRRIVLGGRSTYFCPGCQRRLRRRRSRRAAGRAARATGARA